MQQATIPFDEIVAGASARLCVIDNVQYLSIRDVIMHICDLTSIRANEKWRLLSDEVKNELAELPVSWKRQQATSSFLEKATGLNL